MNQRVKKKSRKFSSSDARSENDCDQPVKKKFSSLDVHSENDCDDISMLISQYKESISPELEKKLESLRVRLRHDPLPQHCIEGKAGSHVLTQEEKEQFEKYAPIKRGTFTPMEDKVIVKNWKAFCKLHDWDVTDTKAFMFMRHDRKIFVQKLPERRRFVQFLADGLPNRTLYSVYHRFRNLYEPHIQSRYTEREDDLILTHIEKNPNLDKTRKFADLAIVLNRSRASVWRRYQLLKNKGKKRKISGKTHFL
ncbi:uncharacterized protein LOC105702278 [Orussus abietinus]|uniref:uncharacterized protein LOC105702278 n=1 Tax=Orussus abietinus TaxID=222816 RepID=UPI0006257F8F|nr:uncharacterized protein LOC105702278 [Orussus abietinus]